MANLPEDTQLLLRSAEHWLENFDRFQKGLPLRVSTESCPLCRVYNPRELIPDPCRGCPVFEHTGQTACRTTPYYKVIRAPEGSADQLAGIVQEYQFLLELAFNESS